MKLLVAIALLSLVGCASYIEPDVSGPYDRTTTHAIAWQWAKSVGGAVYEVDNSIRSMGPVLSEHAFVIVIPAWAQIKKYQMILREDAIVHETVYVFNGVWKTSGRGNSAADSGWITEDDYDGTVIAQVYYNP